MINEISSIKHLFHNKIMFVCFFLAYLIHLHEYYGLLDRFTSSNLHLRGEHYSLAELLVAHRYLQPVTVALL